jgi:hypothetical protein
MNRPMSVRDVVGGLVLAGIFGTLFWFWIAPPPPTLVVNSAREVLDPRWGDHEMLAVSVTVSRGQIGSREPMNLNTTKWQVTTPEGSAYQAHWQAVRGECSHEVAVLPGGSITCTVYFPKTGLSPTEIVLSPDYRTRIAAPIQARSAR